MNETPHYDLTALRKNLLYSLLNKDLITILFEREKTVKNFLKISNSLKNRESSQTLIESVAGTAKIQRSVIPNTLAPSIEHYYQWGH